MKKKYQKMLLIASMMLLLCGCQKEESTADTSAKKDTTSETTTSQKEEGTFDFEEVCKQIVIDGKQVELPFTLDDLGKGYSFDENTALEYGDKPLCSVHIKYPEEGDLYVTVSEDKVENINRKSQVVGVGISKSKSKASLFGIEIGAGKEQIIEKLGQPTEIIEDEESCSFYYKENIGFISFFLIDGQLETISIYKY